jgi:hypothetical protein
MLEFADPTGHCYRLLAQPLAWDGARTACVTLGAGFDLAVIASIPERDYVGPAIETFPTPIWIGANDLVTESVFMWVNAEPWAYVNGMDPWAPGEPTNSNGIEHCVQILPGGRQFNDGECAFLAASLCERPPQ